MNLTASFSSGGASVALTLTPSGTVDGITRTDANGTAPVRVPEGTFPRTAALNLTDWEAALSGPVTYRAGGVSVQTQAGTVLPCLVPVLRPSLSRTLQEVTGYTAARASMTTVHQVIDRPDPLIALGRMGLRSGSLVIWAETHAAAQAVETLADTGGVLMFKQSEHPGQDLYFVPLGSSLEPDRDGDGWEMTLSYQETSRPDGAG